MHDDLVLEQLRGDLLHAWPRARAVRSRRQLRHLASTGAVVLVAAALAAVALLRPGHEQTAAARVLQRLSAKAAAQPGIHLQRGEYWYVRIVALERSSELASASLQVVVHESWQARDGSGRIRIVRSGQVFDTQQPPVSMVIPFGSRSLSWAELESLPSDVDALEKLVEEAAVRNSWPLAYQEFDLIGELLRNAPVPPAVARSLYEVLARLPGVTLEGRATDALGRQGLAVSIAGGLMCNALVVDPLTGRLLASEELAPETAKVESRFVALDPTTGKILVATDGNPPDVLYAETVAAAGVVNSTTDRP